MNESEKSVLLPKEKNPETEVEITEIFEFPIFDPSIIQQNLYSPF